MIGHKFPGQSSHHGIFSLDKFVSSAINIRLVVAQPQDFTNSVRGTEPMAGNPIQFGGSNSLTQPAFLGHGPLVGPNDSLTEWPGRLVQRHTTHHLSTKNDTSNICRTG